MGRFPVGAGVSVVGAGTAVGVGYRRNRATWVAFGALFAFGVLNAVLGPLLPYLRAVQHTSYLVGSLHQVAFAVGYIAAGLQASRSDSPRRLTIVVGLVVAAAAGVLLAYGRALPVTLVAVLIMSASATAALIRVWALLADLHHERRAVAMTEGEVSVSLAGVLTPLVIGLCAATPLGWQFSSVIAAVLVLTATVAVWLTPVLDPTAPPPRDDASPRRASSRRTLVTILAIVAAEVTLTFWAATYLHDDVGLARDTAVTAVSALFAAQLAGRLLASRLARRLSATTLLWSALAVAVIGCPVLLTATGPAQALVGLVVAGAGIGATFPLAASLHVAASTRSADQALGQILTVAGVSQIIGPLVAGAVAQVDDLRTGLIAVPVLALLAAATIRRPPDRKVTT